MKFLLKGKTSRLILTALHVFSETFSHYSIFDQIIFIWKKNFLFGKSLDLGVSRFHHPSLVRAQSILNWWGIVFYFCMSERESLFLQRLASRVTSQPAPHTHTHPPPPHTPHLDSIAQAADPTWELFRNCPMLPCSSANCERSSRPVPPRCPTLFSLFTLLPVAKTPRDYLAWTFCFLRSVARWNPASWQVGSAEAVWGWMCVAFSGAERECVFIRSGVR